jgi:hypothetical protein
MGIKIISMLSFFLFRYDSMLYRANIRMEPTTGIEPVNLFLTKEALYRLSYVGGDFHLSPSFGRVVFRQPYPGAAAPYKKEVERETRLELATFSLEG